MRSSTRPRPRQAAYDNRLTEDVPMNPDGPRRTPPPLTEAVAARHLAARHRKPSGRHRMLITVGAILAATAFLLMALLASSAKASAASPGAYTASTIVDGDRCPHAGQTYLEEGQAFRCEQRNGDDCPRWHLIVWPCYGCHPSTSPSATASPCRYCHPSKSPTASPSTSTSPSMSPSTSPSASVTGSATPSASASPIGSPSASMSDTPPPVSTSPAGGLPNTGAPIGGLLVAAGLLLAVGTALLAVRHVTRTWERDV